MNSPSLRVLIVGLNYAPEPTGNAPYTTKLAEGLHRLGHDVSVITGYPHYPWWRVMDGYTGMSMKETVRGVRVKRVRHYVPSKPRFASRAVMELSFGIRATTAGWGDQDVVLVVSPALLASAFAIVKSRTRRKPVVMWVQDLYSLGIEETSGKSSVASKIMKRLESKIFNLCDGVIVIHERFRKYVIDELGNSGMNVKVIRNWAHIVHPEPFNRNEVRTSLGWDEDEVIALHAGNMGVKQGLENIVEAARLADALESSVRFVLLGDGNRRKALEEAGQGIRSLTFMRPLSDQAYSEALRAADVLVVNEMGALREMSVPSKLTSYFTTGLPIVAASDESSATADEIELSGAGIRVQPEDPSALLQAVETLGSDTRLSDDLGRRGRRYAANVLSEDAGIFAHVAWLWRASRSRPRPTWRL